jgi:hypothetical protein
MTLGQFLAVEIQARALATTCVSRMLLRATLKQYAQRPLSVFDMNTVDGVPCSAQPLPIGKIAEHPQRPQPIGFQPHGIEPGLVFRRGTMVFASPLLFERCFGALMRLMGIHWFVSSPARTMWFDCCIFLNHLHSSTGLPGSASRARTHPRRRSTTGCKAHACANDALIVSIGRSQIAAASL